MNNSEKLPSELLRSFRPEDIQLYLSARGWVRDATASSTLGSMYRYPENEDAEALLPVRRELADYEGRVADIIQILAVVEGRSVWQILSDISCPSADILRVQVVKQSFTRMFMQRSSIGTVLRSTGIQRGD